MDKLKPLISKQEFVVMVNWINDRWTNNTYTQVNLKRYYDDFKNFSPDTAWEALQDLFDKGLKFAPTPSEWRKQCLSVSQAHAGEYERRDRSDIKGELPTGEEAMSANREGLIRYLDGMGYGSFWEAVYEAGHKRYINGQATVTDGDLYKQPWEEAKKWFLEGKSGSQYLTGIIPPEENV
jgi:hypothetical protein